MAELVQETQQDREILEESRAAESAAGPDIDRLRQREAAFLRELRRHNHDSAIILMLCYEGIGHMWNPKNPGPQKASK